MYIVYIAQLIAKSNTVLFHLKTSEQERDLKDINFYKGQ